MVVHLPVYCECRLITISECKVSALPETTITFYVVNVEHGFICYLRTSWSIMADSFLMSYQLVATGTLQPYPLFYHLNMVIAAPFHGFLNFFFLELP